MKVLASILFPRGALVLGAVVEAFALWQLADHDGALGVTVAAVQILVGLASVGTCYAVGRWAILSHIAFKEQITARLNAADLADVKAQEALRDEFSRMLQPLASTLTEIVTELRGFGPTGRGGVARELEYNQAVRHDLRNYLQVLASCLSVTARQVERLSAKAGDSWDAPELPAFHVLGPDRRKE